jgi:hypothetical protein
MVTRRAGQLEVRIGESNWYWAEQVQLDDDPIRAAKDVAHAEGYFAASRLIEHIGVPPLRQRRRIG